MSAFEASAVKTVNYEKQFIAGSVFVGHVAMENIAGDYEGCTVMNNSASSNDSYC